MSADNGIYILENLDKYKINNNGEKIFVVGGIMSYRVAHIRAFDNFSYFKRLSDSTKLYRYVKETWGDCQVFYDKSKAYICADGLYSSIKYVEYGINMVGNENYDFYSKEKELTDYKQRVINEFRN